MPDEVALDGLAGDRLMRRLLGVGGMKAFSGRQSNESPLGVDPKAFKPSSADVDGLSLSLRASDRRPTCLEPDAFVLGRIATHDPERLYYVLEVDPDAIVGDSTCRMTLRPDPLDDDPGHMVIPELNIATPTGARRDYQRHLVRKCCRRIYGPYNCNGRVKDRWIDWTRETEDHAA